MRQQELDAAREQMAQLHNAQYERALKQLASSDTGALVHYCFSILRDQAREARNQREIDAARDRLGHIHNARYEQALKAWASRDVKSLLHYTFAVWHEGLEEVKRQQELDAAREQMTQLHNTQYERALKQLASCDGALVHYCFSILCDEA